MLPSEALQLVDFGDLVVINCTCSNSGGSSGFGAMVEFMGERCGVAAAAATSTIISETVDTLS